ncbi:MAG: AAA-like domain-containing protein [Polyangia bacterium]
MALLSFGDFVLDTAEKRILRGTRPVDLPGMPLAVLAYFLERAADGRLVTKAELRAEVWGCKVEDVTIRACLSSVREALGDDVSSPRYLHTQGREGWRLLMPVLPQHAASPRPLPPAPGAAYDPACYVPRPAEERVLLSCLQSARRPVVVFGPPGSGKRTLIDHTVASAISVAGSAPLGRTLRISLRPLAEPPIAALDAGLKELGRLLLEADGRSAEATQQLLDPLWSRPVLAKQKLRELVIQHLIPSTGSDAPTLPLALVLADVDRLAGCPFQDDVFNMLRAWQEDRFLGALRIVLESLLPPRLFPLGGQSPLWTKAQRIDVSCTSAREIAQLADLHAIEATAPACDRLGELVGWNLLLCRTAIFQAAVQGRSLDAELAQYQPSRRQFAAFTDHLEDLSQELERLEALGTWPKPLVTLLQEAQQGVSLPPEPAWRLLQKGVLAETETRGRYRLRCPLYADYFGSRAQ